MSGVSSYFSKSANSSAPLAEAPYWTGFYESVFVQVQKPEPLPEDWEDQVRQAMIHRGAPLPSSISCYTRGHERLCIITIPRESRLTVEESHARLTKLNKKSAGSNGVGDSSLYSFLVSPYKL